MRWRWPTSPVYSAPGSGLTPEEQRESEEGASLGHNPLGPSPLASVSPSWRPQQTLSGLWA